MADKNFKVKSGLQVPSLATAGPVTTDSSGNVSSVSALPIDQGGTGQTTAANALNALLPLQTGNENKYLQTNGVTTQWNKVYNQTIQNAGININPRGNLNIVGAIITDDSGTDTTTLTLNPAIKTIDEKTGHYTIATSDNNKIIEVNSSSNVNITIPTNTTDSISVGSTISIVNKGTGSVNFIGQQGSLPLTSSSVVADFDGIAYGNSIFTAYKSSSYYTSTDGINWTSRTNPFGSVTTINKLKFIEGKFYVLSASQSRIASSSDGINWTTVNSAASGALRNIDYGNGKYIVVGDDALMLTSNDGVSWTTVSSPAGLTTQDFRAVVYTKNNIWYAMVQTGSNLIVKSTDNGETWTQETGQFGWSSNVTWAVDFYFYDPYIIGVANVRYLRYFNVDSGTQFSNVIGISDPGGTAFNISFVGKNSIYYALLSGTNSTLTTSYLYTSTDGINYTLSTSASTGHTSSSAFASAGAISDSGLIVFANSTTTKVFTTGTEVASIYSLDSSKAISKRYGKAEIYKYGSNDWLLSGDLDSKTVDVELNNDSYYNLMGVI